MLKESEGIDVSLDQLIEAKMAHQRLFSLSDVRY